MSFSVCLVFMGHDVGRWDWSPGSPHWLRSPSASPVMTCYSILGQTGMQSTVRLGCPGLIS